MLHNARVLDIDTDIEIIKELRRVKAEEAGIRHMLPKTKHYIVKLENVRCPIAHILKESFLSNGGDAAIGRDVITASVTHTDLLLMGTHKQYKRVISALREQAFGCKDLAKEIETAITNYESRVVLPDLSSIDDQHLRAMYEKIGKQTLIMGILNVTPDSFSDGGKYTDISAAVDHAVEMVESGADIIDLGGESTRPGSDPLSEEDEIDRIVPVISKLSEKITVPISIDTYKSKVAEAALDNGASIINDISACLFDPDMIPLIVKRQCPAIIMHIKGTPKDMQQNPVYEDLIGEVYSFLMERIKVLVDAGVDDRLLIIDPGIGFCKTVNDNLEIMRRLKEFKSMGRPILMGTSRKGTIGKVLGNLPANDRVEGTAATVAISIANGADIVRVHDVKEMCRVAKMTDAILRSI